MLTCEQTQHLFDAYLDDELSSSLRSEVHAHRLDCTDCNHQLALLECCGDVVTGTGKEPALVADFTEQILSRMAPVSSGPSDPSVRFYRLFAPMAAAAAAIVITVLIAPPISTKAPVLNKLASREAPGPAALSAQATLVTNPEGKMAVVTVMREKDETGEFRTTEMYKEASASLAEMMIHESLVPTVQGLGRLRLSHSALQELGRMVLLQSMDGLRNTSGEGEEIVPASPTPAEPTVPLEPAFDPFNFERRSEGFLPT